MKKNNIEKEEKKLNLSSLNMQTFYDWLMVTKNILVDKEIQATQHLLKIDVEKIYSALQTENPKNIIQFLLNISKKLEKKTKLSFKASKLLWLFLFGIWDKQNINIFKNKKIEKDLALVKPRELKIAYDKLMKVFTFYSYLSISQKIFFSSKGQVAEQYLKGPLYPYMTLTISIIREIEKQAKKIKTLSILKKELEKIKLD